MKTYYLFSLVLFLCSCTNALLNNSGGGGTVVNFQKAIAFDGIDDTAIATWSPSSTISSGGTFEAFVRFDNAGAGGVRHIMGFAAGGGHRGGLYLGVSGVLCAEIPTSACSSATALCTSYVPASFQKLHIAVVWNNSLKDVYVNGVKQTASPANTFTGCTSNINTINLGFSAGDFHNDVIDEVRLSDTVRYLSNFTAPTAPFSIDSETLVLLHLNDATTVDYVRSGSGVLALSNGASLTTSPFP